MQTIAILRIVEIMFTVILNTALKDKITSELSIKIYHNLERRINLMEANYYVNTNRKQAIFKSVEINKMFSFD